MQNMRADILLRGVDPAKQPGSELITDVTTDSRTITPGCVFVAFAGANFDGNAFAAEAYKQGAVYVVVNHPVEGVPEARQLICPDSYRAMLTIGGNYRAQFHPVLIGVTGSVGKTTTKGFTYAILSAFGESIKNPGNKNNELGVPQTVLQITDSTRYGVVEMGMNHSGEISRIVRCARPSAGLITCVGTAHIGNLGSREAICRAKLEICEGLPEGAPLALNGDDDYLPKAELPAHVRPVWFAIDNPQADVRAENIRGEGENTCFTLLDAAYGNFAVTIPGMGRHLVYDALAAYSAATRLGLDAETCAQALSGFVQTGLRQHVVKHGGVTFIEDCYNANPDSMRAALTMYRDYPCAGRRAALLGDMLELGSVSEAAHLALADLAAANKVDYLVLQGENCRPVLTRARALGIAADYAENHAEAAQLLRAYLKPQDALLAKASRGMALEKTLQLLYEAADE